MDRAGWKGPQDYRSIGSYLNPNRSKFSNRWRAQGLCSPENTLFTTTLQALYFTHHLQTSLSTSWPDFSRDSHGSVGRGLLPPLCQICSRRARGRVWHPCTAFCSSNIGIIHLRTLRGTWSVTLKILFMGNWETVCVCNYLSINPSWGLAGAVQITWPDTSSSHPALLGSMSTQGWGQQQRKKEDIGRFSS